MAHDVAYERPEHVPMKDPGPAMALAPRPAGVALELDDLRDTAAKLTSLFSDLRDRLTPVLRESVPTPAEPPFRGDNPEPASTVASSIRGETEVLRLLLSRMVDVLNRVDV